MTIKEKVGAGLLVLGLAGAVIYRTGQLSENLDTSLNAYFREDIFRKGIIDQRLKLERKLWDLRYLNQGEIENTNPLKFAEEVLEPAQQYHKTAQECYDQISNPYFKKVIEEYKKIIYEEGSEEWKNLGLLLISAISLTLGGVTVGPYLKSYLKKRKEKTD